MHARLIPLACTLALLSISGTVRAEGAVAPAMRFVAADWRAASDSALDQLRGGFALGNSLAVSFGFMRSVSINGELVSQTQFTLPDLTHITAEQARMVADALSSAQIVQNGVGNSLGTALASLTAGTVVQNSLNNQLIQTQTVIDTGVNSLGLMHALNAQGTLRDALTGALGLH